VLTTHYSTVHTFAVITQNNYFASSITPILLKSERQHWSNMAFITKIVQKCCQNM